MARIMIVVFIVIGLMAGLSARVAAQSEDGLVAEWHFDRDAKDSSGNGNDGTIYGATFVDGKFGKGLSLNGISDRVDLPNLFTTKPKEMTLEAWVKSNKNGGQTIIYNGNYESSIGISSDNKFGVSAKLTDENWYEAKTDWTISLGKWYHIVGIVDTNNNLLKLYINGDLETTISLPSGNTLFTPTCFVRLGAYQCSWTSPMWLFGGIVDEVRIYNRILSAEEIKAIYEEGSTVLTLTKEVSPYSIRQYQTTNVTILIKNTGTSDIRDLEVTDSTNSNLELIGGDFPNPKKYNSLSPGESRDIRYILKSKESGTFILNPATVSYSDNTGNIKIVKSEPVSLTVVPSSEGSPEISSPSDIGTSSAVLLHGEKTDVVLGEDILLKLSAVNLITKPPMSVQVMIYPPSGMSVTGSEFVKSGAGIYTTTYTLNPGDGKDIEVHIKSNQVGDFNVKGRIVYYFGEDKPNAEDHTLNLPIKVRKEPGQTAPSSTDDTGTSAKTPGFEGIFATIVLVLVLVMKKNR